MHKLVLGGYDLDLAPDFGILISKSIADVRDPENRNSDWTKSIRLPGSKTNKKAFSHLFELNGVIQNTSSTNFNPDFNPNLKADVVHYVDEIEQLRGFLRLNNIIQTDWGTIEFECTMYGKTADLWSSITEAKLRDLDFTEFNHTLNVTRVTESWDTRIQKNGSNYTNFDASGNTTGEGYVYALIDDGTYVNYYGDTNVSQFYPALYKKQIVDKIFEAAGHEYTSDSFFNTQFFKRQIVPCPTGMKLSADDLEEREFEAELTFDDSSPVQLTFDQVNFDNGSNYFPSEFDSPVDGAAFDFYVYLKASFTGLSNNTNYSFGLRLFKNGTPYANATYTFTTNGSGNGSIDATAVFTNVQLNDGDAVDVRRGDLKIVGGGFVLFFTYSVLTGSKFYNKARGISWGNGGVVDFDAFFDGDITQYDFLKSVFNEFNIYAEPQGDKIYLNPRDDFYTDEVEDWTDKLDQSKELEIVPMGELNANPYTFTHTKGEDKENVDYQAAYNRVYGDKNYFVNNDFLKTQKKIELVFAPSQFRKVEGFDKYLTYIPLEMDNGTGQLRSLYYGGLQTCNTYLIYDSPNMSGSSTAKTSYPLTLHLDSPESSTLDLCFGMPFRVNLPAGTPYTNNNLFNAYWRKYVTEITDKNSKIVRGWFNLKPGDIEGFSFRKVFYFERNYFRLNLIEDYNPDGDLTHCEFLQLVVGVPFTGSSGIGGETDSLGDFFPSNEQRREIDGSALGQVGLVVGRDNSKAGIQSLIVGDSNATHPDGRVNSIIGSDRINIRKGIHHATVINSADVEPASNEVWLQDHKVTLGSPSNGNVPVFNSVTNAWEPGNITPGYTASPESSSPLIVSPTTGEYIYLIDSSGGAFMVNLPTAVGNTAKFTFIKVSGDGNTITTTPDGAETISGAPTKTIVTQWNTWTIISDNSNWIVI